MDVASLQTEYELIYHAKELSEKINRHFHLIFSCPNEEGRHWETGADCGEIVVRVHSTAIWEVGTWNEKGQMMSDETNWTTSWRYG